LLYQLSYLPVKLRDRVSRDSNLTKKKDIASKLSHTFYRI
jgi:hypothetical protein